LPEITGGSAIDGKHPHATIDRTVGDAKEGGEPMKRATHYRGFTIEQEASDLFAVRLFQPDLDIWHDWKPWLPTLAEAKAVVDRLVEEAEAAETTGVAS
jgi:hypothetical protein